MIKSMVNVTKVPQHSSTADSIFSWSWLECIRYHFALWSSWIHAEYTLPCYTPCPRNLFFNRKMVDKRNYTKKGKRITKISVQCI